MFTGIVREIGSVVAVTGGDEGVQLEIDAPATAPLVDVGGSVAINGVCLTAESVGADPAHLPCRPRDAVPLDARPAGRTGRASTSSRRSGQATRWAATSSRGTSTGSARCALRSPKAKACG